MIKGKLCVLGKLVGGQQKSRTVFPTSAAAMDTIATARNLHGFDIHLPSLGVGRFGAVFKVPTPAARASL